MRALDAMRSALIALNAAAVLSLISSLPASAGQPRSVISSSVVPCSARPGKFSFGALGLSRFGSFTTMISVSCPPDLSYRLVLHSANGCRLASGASTLAYALFLDAAYSKAAMDCGPTVLELAGKGSMTFMFYGRTQQLSRAAQAGDYNDAISLEIVTDP